MSQFLLRRHNDDETSEICSNDVTTCEDLRYYRVIIIEGLKKTTKTLMIMVPLLWTCIMRVACGATELNVSVSQSVTLQYGRLVNQSINQSVCQSVLALSPSRTHDHILAVATTWDIFCREASSLTGEGFVL
jgi:hypothetical protein